MLTMIYMTRRQDMSFFLLKVNNPSVRHPAWPPFGPRRASRPAPIWPPLDTPVWPPSSTPVCPSDWPCLVPSSPLFGWSQGYEFSQICITLCPSCIASLKTLALLLWIHCVRPIVQGGFKDYPILDYHDLQDHMHDQFHASIFFSSSI
jgi:hypothetical protein